MSSRRPTVKDVKDWLNLDGHSAEILTYVIQNPSQAKLHLTDDIPNVKYIRLYSYSEQIMELANFLMSGFGVETIYARGGSDSNLVAVYVNTGDVYNPTLLYDYNGKKFVLTTWGDWVEKNRKRYDLD